MLNYRQNFSKIIFCLQTALEKIQVSQAQSNWFSFQETATYKRQGHADLHNPDMNRIEWVRQQLCTVMVWVLSSVIIIAQINTINIEYATGWLKK